MKEIKIPAGMDLRDHWYFKCLMYAHENKLSSLLMILRALRRREYDSKSPVPDRVFPRLGGACHISASGKVMAMYQSQPGAQMEWTSIGTTKQVEGALRRCADRARISDEDRKELFQSFNDWILKDERAKSTE